MKIREKEKVKDLNKNSKSKFDKKNIDILDDSNIKEIYPKK